VFGTGVEKLIIEAFRQARFPGDSAEGFVTTGQAILGGSDAHFI
jgi:hypothetical protein